MKKDNLIKQLCVILDNIQDNIKCVDSFKKWNKAQILCWKLINEIERIRNGF